MEGMCIFQIFDSSSVWELETSGGIEQYHLAEDTHHQVQRARWAEEVIASDSQIQLDNHTKCYF